MLVQVTVCNLGRT